MSLQAHAFAFVMKQKWSGKIGGEENARSFAERFAKRLEDVTVPDVWIDKPGDVKFGLYQWPDGSRYLVSDNGDIIHKAQYSGVKKRLTYTIAV